MDKNLLSAASAVIKAVIRKKLNFNTEIRLKNCKIITDKKARELLCVNLDFAVEREEFYKICKKYGVKPEVILTLLGVKFGQKSGNNAG